MTLSPAPALVLLALISLACGSFVAALAYRLPRGLGLGGRSHCPHCGASLAARDLVPVLSWFWLKGRCRRCGVALGLYYPAVELAALALGFWAWAATGGWLLAASCGLAWTLLALTLIDGQHLILPDEITLPLAAAGLAVGWLAAPQDIADNLAGAAAGYVSFVVVAWGYRRWRGREGLGAGDAKLLAAGGAWVGLGGLASVVLIAALLALAGVLAVRVFGRRLAAADRVPFGPALAAAVWLVWLYGPLRLA